jgi:hypothetical protein
VLYHERNPQKTRSDIRRFIKFRRPRFITVLEDGNKPRDEEAVDALLAPLNVQPEDTVVVVARFVEVDDLPRVASVT